MTRTRASSRESSRRGRVTRTRASPRKALDIKRGRPAIFSTKHAPVRDLGGDGPRHSHTAAPSSLTGFKVFEKPYDATAPAGARAQKGGSVFRRPRASAAQPLGLPLPAVRGGRPAGTTWTGSPRQLGNSSHKADRAPGPPRVLTKFGCHNQGPLRSLCSLGDLTTPFATVGDQE